MESGSEAISTVKGIQTQIISGLPDDIALLCLARVPRKYHTVLKCVSKRWKELVCSDEWHAYRQKNNLSEAWIYALCRDKSERLSCYVLDPESNQRSWKPISEPPPRCLKRKGVAFEALGNKLYLLGGCGWSEDATDEVFCYNVSTNSWSEAAPLSTKRCYFACQALNGKIYATGGLVCKLSDPHSCDTFDPEANKWELHCDANIVPEVEDSIVMDSKMYVRSSTSAVCPNVHAVSYEPLRGAWQHADADMVSGWRGPAVIVNGTFYVLDQSLGTRLMMWQKDQGVWVAVMRLIPLLTRPPCQMVAMGTNIFIIGKGLSTIVFDVNKFRKTGGGAVAGSYIPRLEDIENDVVSCKCLAV